jgi:hypothetical protein
MNYSCIVCLHLSTVHVKYKVFKCSKYTRLNVQKLLQLLLQHLHHVYSVRIVLSVVTADFIVNLFLICCEAQFDQVEFSTSVQCSVVQWSVV